VAVLLPQQSHRRMLNDQPVQIISTLIDSGRQSSLWCSPAALLVGRGAALVFPCPAGCAAVRDVDASSGALDGLRSPSSHTGLGRRDLVLCHRAILSWIGLVRRKKILDSVRSPEIATLLDHRPEPKGYEAIVATAVTVTQPQSAINSAVGPAPGPAARHGPYGNARRLLLRRNRFGE